MEFDDDAVVVDVEGGIVIGFVRSPSSQGGFSVPEPIGSNVRCGESNAISMEV